MKAIFDVLELHPLDMQPGDIIAWIEDGFDEPNSDVDITRAIKYRIVTKVEVDRDDDKIALIHFRDDYPHMADRTLLWAIWRESPESELLDRSD